MIEKNTRPVGQDEIDAADEEIQIGTSEYHGGLEASEWRSAALEKRQAEEEEEYEDDRGNADFDEPEREDPYADDLAREEYLRQFQIDQEQRRAEEDARLEASYAREERNYSRWNELIELYDYGRHDFNRFEELANNSGYRERDDWKVEDIAEALKGGAATRTFWEGVQETAAGVRVQAGNFLRSWFGSNAG